MPDEQAEIIEMSKLGNGGSANDTNKALAEAIANTTRLMARR